MPHQPSPFPELDFPWETLAAIISGQSAIDVPVLQVQDVRVAEGFLECYGFDWADSVQREELSQLRRESLSFIADLLADEPNLDLPAEVNAQADVRKLLCWASVGFGTPRQRWSCALLRVMHTLAHASSYFNRRFGPEIREQILRRFEGHLTKLENGFLLGTGADSIPVEAFEIKGTKSRLSIAIKLLHKPENVATDIFDRIGVRFVTAERFDVLRVVRYLRRHNVIMFANVKPSRSRNSLVDLETVRAMIERVDPDSTSTEALGEVQAAVRHLPRPPIQRPENPHSGVDYHSLQITCRQLIRVPNPFEPDGGSIRFFFPFEIQVLDAESYEISRSGLAAHGIYKARQRETVKRRVFGALLDH